MLYSAQFKYNSINHDDYVYATVYGTEESHLEDGFLRVMKEDGRIPEGVDSTRYIHELWAEAIKVEHPIMPLITIQNSRR